MYLSRRDEILACAVSIIPVLHWTVEPKNKRRLGCSVISFHVAGIRVLFLKVQCGSLAATST